MHLERQFRGFSNKAADDRTLVTHLSSLQIALADSQSAQRGYVLTGEATFLKSYGDAVLTIDRELSSLGDFRRSDPSMRTLIHRVDSLVRQNLAEVGFTINERRDLGFEEALNAVRGGVGVESMKQVNVEIGGMQALAKHEWLANIQQRDRLGATNLALTIGGNVLLALILVTCLNSVRVADRDRDAYLQEAAESKARAEQDVRSLSRAIQELRISEARSRLLFEGASQGILTVDETGKILTANRTAETLFRYGKHSLIGVSVDMLLPPELRGRHASFRTGFMKSSSSRPMGRGMNLAALRQDGSQFPVEISLSFLSDEQNGGFAVAFISDITARVKFEQRLSTLVKRLSLATEALKIGIWEWDLSNNLVEWDDTMRMIYGVSQEVTVDYQLWARSVLPEDLAQAENAMREAIEQKKQSSMCFRITLPDGNSRFIESVFDPTLDDDHNVLSLVGTNIDVTERRNIEAAASERSVQLQIANKELEDFAYIASHDLKAPLRVIDNASKWLEEDLQEHLTDETRGTMNLLRGRVRRMERLLNDLLEYARIGRTTDSRYAELLTGDLLVTDVLTLLPVGDITVTVSEQFRNFRFPRMPLQQVLLNLIGNAIKHHDKTQGWVNITITEKAEHYVFAVQDNGPGIAEPFQEQIFKMFQTLKPRDRVEGSGMGLATVRKTVEIFGGCVSLDSVEGRGSTFTFTWPKQQRARETAA